MRLWAVKFNVASASCSGAGASSAATVKRLKGVVQCLVEITERGVTAEPAPGASEASSDGRQGQPPAAAGAAIAAAARAFQARVLRELPSLVLQPGEAVRQHVAGCAASPLCVYLGTKNGFPALIWPLEGACRHGQYISGQYQPMAAC